MARGSHGREPISTLDALNNRGRRYGGDVPLTQLNVRIPVPLKQRWDAVIRGLRVSPQDYMEALLEELLPRSEEALGINQLD